jgi:hypothetical protein
MTKGKPAGNSDPLADIHKIIDDSYKVKASTVKELSEIGGILVSRDDFLRLSSSFSGMMDSIEVITMRLTEVKSRDWKLSKSQAEGMGAMADLGFDALTKLRDSIMSLGFNSEKATSFAKDIDEIEKKLDLLYIKLDVDIVTGKSDSLYSHHRQRARARAAGIRCMRRRPLHPACRCTTKDAPIESRHWRWAARRLVRIEFYSTRLLRKPWQPKPKRTSTAPTRPRRGRLSCRERQYA